jgi:peptidoglycan/xylan/chitin deacetylase (PgdA/CDA1 family)
MPFAGAVVRAADLLLARPVLRAGYERAGLIILLFHGLFENQAEVEHGDVHPLEGITTGDLHMVIEHFLENRYQFIDPDELPGNLNVGGRYAMLSFDDSYARHQYALSVLEEFDVPALFLITTAHVLEGKGYWWDTLYRERHKRGARRDQIDREIQVLKARTGVQIDDYLIANFGTNCLQPAGELDRPMTPPELACFSHQPGVYIGNHTRSHAILTKYSDPEVEGEIVSAQAALGEITGKVPQMIAYPNGCYDNRILHIADRCGLRFGVTCDPHKNCVPIEEQRLRLGRFGFRNSDNVLQQCTLIRSDYSIRRYLGRHLL